MSRVIAFTLVLLGIGLVACAAPKPAPVPTTITPAHKSGILRIAIVRTPNVKDIPRLMAIDVLKEEGYTVTLQAYNDSALIPAAMQREDIEIGDSTSNQAWTAITKGLDVRSVVGLANMTFYFVTKPDVQTCRDLDGRSIAFSNRTSVGYVMFDDYLKQKCPGASPQIVLISDSHNRIAALQSGNVDGAYLEIEDWLQLDSQAPGKFRVLVDFAKEFPKVQYSTFTVRRAWAQQNPEIVKDFIRALLAAHRRLVGNSGLLRDAIVKYLSVDTAAAQYSANAITPLKVWDVNGALTTENLQYSIDYFEVKSSLQSGTKVNDVADLSYLNAVLDEIGRR
jgi:NitT/TauT family transport system substrate-binding protein